MINDFFNRTCSVVVMRRGSQDEVGGVVSSESSIAADEPCMISPLPPLADSYGRMHGSVGVRASHKLYMSARLSGVVTEGMKIRSSRGVGLPFQEFEIEGIEDPQYRGRFMKVFLVEIKGSGATR